MMQSLLRPVFLSDICMQGSDWLGQLACDREEEDGSEDDDKAEEDSPSYEEDGSLGRPAQRCQTLQPCQHMNCFSTDSLTSQ